MFLAFVSLFFCWLIYREVTSRKVAVAGFSSFDISYIIVLILLATLSAWKPIHYWRFEHLLTAKAQMLSENPSANVHCNTAFDTIFDDVIGWVGHANPETGDIVLQYTWCEKLMNYLNHPDHASDDEIYSLSVFTHESMHARGERNESKTECQAVQRNYRSGKLLGIPDSIAQKNALYHYETLYKNRHPYFTHQCAPGAEMDEHLGDSTWPTH